ncbi:MAG: methyltransferase domain-containing protein [Candidatus Sungbacteria bacterium]|nr:methyltransferase domain-containing protein [Candidatus Sungbacteria bacterium]
MDGFIKGTGFLSPEQVVRQFGLEKGDHVADFGSGHGYLTIPMARIVGGDGKIFALDIQKNSLDIIRSKARLEHLLNIETVRADLEEPRGSHIKAGYINFAVISNILFQVENKIALFEEAYRILHRGGKLAVIEWEGSLQSSLGPPLELRIAKDEASRLASEAGFKLISEFDGGTHHYGLLFIKK